MKKDIVVKYDDPRVKRYIEKYMVTNIDKGCLIATDCVLCRCMIRVGIHFERETGYRPEKLAATFYIDESDTSITQDIKDKMLRMQQRHIVNCFVSRIKSVFDDGHITRYCDHENNICLTDDIENCSGELCDKIVGDKVKLLISVMKRYEN